MSETREFTNDGRTAVITESGREGGPVYVLVHGIGMGHRYWSSLANALARSGRVVALDLPGFGDAPEPEEALDMAASGDFLAELIADGGYGRVILVGHSMGTEVVAEAAARHPELASHVVLIAPTVNPAERTVGMQALRMMQDMSMSKPKVLALGTLYYLKAGLRWYVKKLATMLDHRVELTLPRIAAPTLVIRGEKDAVVPRDWAVQVAGLVPDASYVEVPGRGHETMITAGETVARLIAEHAGAPLPVEPPRIPLATVVRVWAADYLYAVAQHVLALLRRRAPLRYAHGDAARPTVLLLPGVYETWSFLRPLAEALNADGYRVRVVHGMRYNRRGIEATAESLERALGRIRTPEAGWVILGHSKGGLIGKRLLVSGSADVRGVVAVSSPFAGSRMARFLPDASIREFLPENTSIVSLASASSVNARITSVYGWFDPHVPDGSELDGATNVQVPVAGHFRVLGAQETADAVREAVRRVS